MADLSRAVLVASVPVAWLLGLLTMTQLYAVALLSGAMTVFFDIGVAGGVVAPVIFGLDNVQGVSIRQTITPDEMLGQKNAGCRFIFMGALSGEAALGGLIGSYAGVRTAIWIGSVIFALS